MVKSWMLAGLVAMGVAGWAAVPSYAADKDDKKADKKDDMKADKADAKDAKGDAKGGDDDVKPVRSEVQEKELPKGIRAKFDKDKDKKISKVVKVARGEKVLYRLTVEETDRTKLIFMREDGTVLDSETIRESKPEKPEASPGVKVLREQVDVDELPGGVKGALGKAYSLNHVEQAWKVTEGKDTHYVAMVYRGGEMHRVRIEPDGSGLKEVSGNKNG